MKITNIECYPVWGGARNFLFVVVDTDEGIYGVGETGITGRELAIIGTIEHFKPLLIGQDPGALNISGKCSIAAAFSRRSALQVPPSAPSTLRCGTSRARRWVCPVMIVWGQSARQGGLLSAQRGAQDGSEGTG